MTDLLRKIGFTEEQIIKYTELKEDYGESLDKIRQRYGKSSIISASVMDSDIGIYDKKDTNKDEDW